ncbi:MAG: PKD domain-containing protein [Candidatus Binatia bacterium]
MLHPRSFRVLSVTVLSGLVLGAGGCNNDQGPGHTTAAATLRTPFSFKPRSHQLSEAFRIPATPKRRDAAVPGSPGHGQDELLYVSAAAEPDTGGTPLRVSFEAEVTGGPPGLTYHWDFGDQSAPAYGLAAQHTYRVPGDYEAIFSVTGPGISETDEVSIEVTEEGFDLAIDADPDIGHAPLTVGFSAVLDEDEAPPFYYQWDFGDGAHDVTNPTTHTYRLPGEYRATLTVTNGQGQSARQDVGILVDPPQDSAAFGEDTD